MVVHSDDSNVWILMIFISTELHSVFTVIHLAMFTAPTPKKSFLNNQFLPKKKKSVISWLCDTTEIWPANFKYEINLFVCVLIMKSSCFLPFTTLGFWCTMACVCVSLVYMHCNRGYYETILKITCPEAQWNNEKPATTEELCPQCKNQTKTGKISWQKSALHNCNCRDRHGSTHATFFCFVTTMNCRHPLRGKAQHNSANPFPNQPTVSVKTW